MSLLLEKFFICLLPHPSKKRHHFWMIPCINCLISLKNCFQSILPFNVIMNVHLLIVNVDIVHHISSNYEYSVFIRGFCIIAGADLSSGNDFNSQNLSSKLTDIMFAFMNYGCNYVKVA